MSDSPAAILFDQHGTDITTVSGVDGVRVGVDATISGSIPAGENVIGTVGLDFPKSNHAHWPEWQMVVDSRGEPRIDLQNRLITRSQVTTDEGSFRDDFSDDLESNLTGTCTFAASTTVIGSGTAFTTEIYRGQMIRADGDAGSKAQAVFEVISDTELLLVGAYTGTAGADTGVKSNWRLWAMGSGSIAQAGSELTVSTGTTESFTHVIREFGHAPGEYTSHLSVSQRIANQVIAVGFRDAPGNAEALVLFDGTNDRTLKVRTSQRNTDVQTTEYQLPAAGVTSDIHAYRILMSPEYVRVWVDETQVAQHEVHIPGPYDHVWAGIIVRNTATAASSTDIVIDSVLVSKRDLFEVKVSGALDNLRADVSGNLLISTAISAASLPLVVNLNFEAPDAAIEANAYKRVLAYVVPELFNGWLIRFSSYQNEKAKSRLVAATLLGTLDIITDAFAAGDEYVVPAWATVIDGRVTTELSSGAGDIIVTVTYTNEIGTTGRTGTLTFAKGSEVDTAVRMSLETGDLGVKSIEDATTDTVLAAGAIELVGNIQLAYHNDLSNTTQVETNYQPGAIAFPAGTILAVEYAGGAVSKDRLFDVLIQLVAEA